VDENGACDDGVSRNQDLTEPTGTGVHFLVGFANPSMTGDQHMALHPGKLAFFTGLAISLAFSAVGFAQKKNPVEASQESVSKGQTIFKKNCQVCHGEKGMGDGPAGQRMNPKPANFTVKSKMTDEELFQAITKGKNPMPAFEHKLNETDRWHVINFIRTLSGPAPTK
jgi:mono/diheme cytochrome c family protein